MIDGPALRGIVLLVTVVQLAVGVGHAAAIGRIMLPAVVGIQTLSTDFIEVIDVDIDVVIAVPRIAIVVIPVMVVMIPVVIIPVDITEDGVGGGYPEAEAKPFDQAVGKLLPRRRR